MTKRRRSRQLTSDERRLWVHVARNVTPMKGKRLPEEPAPEEEQAAHEGRPAAATAGRILALAGSSQRRGAARHVRS